MRQAMSNEGRGTRNRVRMAIAWLSLLVPLLSSLPQAAQAATYYVDFASGNDASNGTSMSTPWKRSPGDGEATGNPRAKVLGPGDTVLFRGGVVYRGAI